MLLSGYLSSKLGIKKTLMVGLVFIGVFATCIGFSSSLPQVIFFRGLWGIGNAIFFATGFTATIALAGKARGKAISLFEAATGIGMAVGPFIGGVLGGFSWTYPFFAIGLMMIIVLVIIAASLPRNVEDKEGIIKSDASILDPVYALKNRSIAIVGLSACLYNFGFFALVAYAPLVMNLSPFSLGIVFLAFSVMIDLTSYFISPKIKKKIGTIKGIYINLLIFIVILISMAVGIRTANVNLMLVSIVIAGGLVGNLNPLFSNAIVEVSTIDKSSTSSSYSFLRFLSGGIAPISAGALAIISSDTPFYIGGIILLISLLILIFNRNYIKKLIETNKKKEADETDDSKIYELKVKDFMTSKVSINET
jgi:MFS family permease